VKRKSVEMPPSADANNNHWTQYWSTDRVAACFEGPQSNYEDTISDQWETFFLALSSPCSILDIGTGNGAVPVIASRIATELGRDYAITGVDLAAIDPHKFVQHEEQALTKSSFLGGVSASSLPFADGHFNAISSQFALEYMDRASVLPELYRVAAAGASLRCIVHAKDGTAAVGARQDLEHCDYLLRESRLFDKARRTMAFVVELERSGVAVSASDDASARKLINGFQTALGRLKRRRQALAQNPMLDNVLEVVVRCYQERASFSADQLQDHMDTLQGEVTAHAARLQELVAAACSSEEIQVLAEQFCAAGFEAPAPSAVLRTGGGGQLGWALQCHKPA
jgi:ubiquinone/menaquinone biosynthesis C-methylase UbiE